ncbi:hypothetical protein HN51_039944 [Arachis hypogaea]|uniref:Ubiquinol-cytochrome c chaperone domain-containing protein n=1 Tax=Arachis hypogaea TaxID=3818 RepID=A0A444YLI1_ARAHY|nr:ubiquinol-cytochrome-c reductase complex assembly factor 1 [Arachis ipaensis]XP_025663086.1 ubiquinol-cytochrome-c reductase complex assembly factor 1 [Arachis hypogaea]QHN85610.1 Ubiquinol-cytochrome-c reductase complex assembly factor [Arachis hypogaea]RYR02813.1 hypothetical protein Ahy_B06g081645 [Arachis hypogaea]
MLQRWRRAFTPLCKAGSLNVVSGATGTRHSYARVAAAPPLPTKDKPFTPQPPLVNLDKMFWSAPCSLALPPDSPRRVEEPNYQGIKRFILKLMLFYSKQSKSIRGANVVYRRIISQVDKPPIYEVFNLEKTFKTTFSLLVLHMWLCLRRLKQEGKEGVEFGQYLYEIYNHDVELRVSKAGVNLLLTKWMKDLEKIFYGNIVAYDTAMLPEAKPSDLATVLWRNIFSDDGSSMPDAGASQLVNAMARYARREVSCMTLTDKEALFSGNFMFTPLKHESQSAKAHQ